MTRLWLRAKVYREASAALSPLELQAIFGLNKKKIPR